MKAKLQYNMDGSIDIILHDFVYVTINYNYLYTHNSERVELAEKILEFVNEQD